MEKKPSNPILSKHPTRAQQSMLMKQHNLAMQRPFLVFDEKKMKDEQLATAASLLVVELFWLRREWRCRRLCSVRRGQSHFLQIFQQFAQSLSIILRAINELKTEQAKGHVARPNQHGHDMFLFVQGKADLVEHVFRADGIRRKNDKYARASVERLLNRRIPPRSGGGGRVRKKLCIRSDSSHMMTP